MQEQGNLLGHAGLVGHIGNVGLNPAQNPHKKCTQLKFSRKLQLFLVNCTSTLHLRSSCTRNVLPLRAKHRSRKCVAFTCIAIYTYRSRYIIMPTHALTAKPGLVGVPPTLSCLRSSSENRYSTSLSVYSIPSRHPERKMCSRS